MSHQINRRSLVKTTAVGAAAGSIGMLGLNGAKLAAAQATPEPDVISIPDPVVDLPTDDVTFRWVDSGDVKGFFWRAFFPAYQEAHPNISMQYDGLPWNEIQKVVPLGIQNGNAPDVFQIPSNIPPAQAATEGWGTALDDIIPDFEDFKSRFPEGTFVPGLTDFGGKTYVLPITSNRRHGTLLLFNRDYMDKAGYDPSETRFTWDQFREAAKKLTEQGAGEYFGLIFEGNQTGRFSNFVNSMARMAGLSFQDFVGASPMDMTTGEFLFTSDEHAAAIELLLALRDDQVIFPGSMSLNAPQARAYMPQGASAMILQGPWNISQWQIENPDFNFGVASTPNASEDIHGYYHVGPGGSNPLWVYAESELTAVAADVFSYMGTLEGQTAWAKIVGIADPAAFPEAQKAIGDNQQANKAQAIFDEHVVLGPDARARNLDIAKVYENIVPVQPDFGTTVQGIYTGQIEDAAKAMQGLEDAWNKELERAIKAAADEGAEVSRDDFVFPNWDPTTDYTQAQYDELEG